jgi:hypothetical protein
MPPESMRRWVEKLRAFERSLAGAGPEAVSVALRTDYNTLVSQLEASTGQDLTDYYAGAEFEIDPFANFDVGHAIPKGFGVRLDLPRFRALVGRLIAHLDDVAAPEV